MHSKFLNGLILAGGRSSRMGSDKSELRYHGQSQHNYLADLLQPFCAHVFVSDRRARPAAEVPVLVDYFDFEGPLNGIMTALRYKPEAAWITVPVDLPNIDAGLIALLIAKRNPAKTATCFLDSAGQPDPLLAIWEPGVYEQIHTYWARGGRSPREFLMENAIERVSPPHANALLNINTPEELAEFRKNLRQIS